MVSLPQGVHVITRRNGRKAYYWRPGRGTPAERDYKAQWCRLPDDPASSEFYSAIERAKGFEKVTGGLEAMVQAYLDSTMFARLKPSSQKVYRISLAEVVKRLGEYDPHLIQTKHIAALRESVARDRPGAAAVMVRVIKRMWKYGVEQGFTVHNPAISLTNEYRPEPHAHWPQEAIDAIGQMAETPRHACLLALYTGQRISDVCRMSLRDVQNGRIRVKQQKTNKDLWIRLHSALTPVLDAARTSGRLHLLSDETGKPYGARSIRKMVARECERLDLGKLVFHGLRKNAINILLEAGCTEAEAAAVTGQSLQMVAHYSRGVSQSRLADAAIGKLEK